MDIRRLRYFSIAAEEQNFTRAARRAGVAQSASSRQIATLEDELGVELFTRGSFSGARLTEVGRAFQADVACILADIDRARETEQRVAVGLGFPRP
jgi:DNA-binding transcriptional LysR family regulator